jgi:hypothetical protein
MAIKFNGNLDDIFGNIYKKFQKQIIPAVIEQLEAVCIDTVAEARRLDTYTDRTGNLRSSIGFVIYHDGQKVKESFINKAGPEAKEGDGQKGADKGASIANAAAQSWPTGIVAVIVAGMDYALFVESKGYDVITGTTKQLGQLLQERLQDIKDVYK